MKQKMILVLLMITMLTSCSTAGGNDHQETTLRSLFGDRFLIGTALPEYRPDYWEGYSRFTDCPYPLQFGGSGELYEM
jgi:hypothetical protein